MIMHQRSVKQFLNIKFIMGSIVLLITFFNGELSALTQDEYDKLRVYSDVLSLIQKNYVDEKDSSEIIL